MIEFPDFTPSDIRHALLHNPLDPKGLLKKTEEAVEKYKGQFPIFRENELRNIILGRPTNPERALAELDDSIRNLQDRFPLFPGFQIKRIVINNGVKNAPSEIERVIELSNRLSGLYPEFSISDIQSVAIDNKDPDTFLQNARSKVIGMQKKFPEISHSLLIKACIDHPDSTESFLREVEKVTKELISIFPDLNEGEIRYVAVRNPKTARDNLSVDLVRIKQLQADHAEIPPWLARRAAIFYRNNPEEFIERVKRRVQELKETNSGKPRWALYEAAVRHVSDPQTFLDNI